MIMRKVLLTLAILASSQAAFAQANQEALRGAIDKAQVAAQNPKKAVKPATWTSLAQAYLNAYTAPTSNVLQGVDRVQLALTMGKDKPVSTENVVLGGVEYSKDVYADKNLYFNAAGQMEFTEVTKPVVEDALAKALEAYKKAHEVDAKGQKTEDITNGIMRISENFAADATTAYRIGDMSKAKVLFEQAYETSLVKPYARIDTASLSNAGLVAFMSNDFASARKFYEKCLDYGYFGDNGSVYARLADCAQKLDTSAVGRTKAKEYLEEGFQKYPNSEENLYGLINYYSASGESADQLFELIGKAKANSPENPSIYYVEGNAYAKLDRYDEALASYREAQKVDPNFNWGYIGEGTLHTALADKLVDEAQKTFDDKKYTELVDQYYKAMAAGIEVYEKAIAITKDENLQRTIGDILKTLYYRLRDQDPKYQAGYDKYSELYK